MKKIIFFDGDGTLWEPPKHKNYVEPWHIYEDRAANPHDEMQATADSLKVLEKVGNLGIKRILLSTSPFEYKKAMQDRTKMVHSTGFKDLIDDIQISPDYPEGKGEKILKILKKYGFKKQDALMVGDMYKWDYKPTQDIGVDALLIKRPYSFKHFENVDKSKIKTIDNLNDLLVLLG